MRTGAPAEAGRTNRGAGGECGAALVIVLLTLLLLSAIGAVLVTASTVDTLVAANAGAAVEALAAARAGLERTMAEVREAGDLTSVLDGTRTSRWIDGPSGRRTLADGSVVDLGEVVTLANCNRLRACTQAELDSSLRDRPWGSRNPRWRVFSSGWLTGAWAPATGHIYVVTLVADDPADTDGNPLVDGGGPPSPLNPGAGVILVRSEAFGRRAAHRTVEATVARLDLVAQAAWAAADPLTRGPAPPAVPQVRLLASREVR